MQVVATWLKLRLTVKLIQVANNNGSEEIMNLHPGLILDGTWSMLEVLGLHKLNVVQMVVANHQMLLLHLSSVKSHTSSLKMVNMYLWFLDLRPIKLEPPRTGKTDMKLISQTYMLQVHQTLLLISIQNLLKDFILFCNQEFTTLMTQ